MSDVLPLHQRPAKKKERKGVAITIPMITTRTAAAAGATTVAEVVQAERRDRVINFKENRYTFI